MNDRHEPDDDELDADGLDAFSRALMQPDEDGVPFTWPSRLYVRLSPRELAQLGSDARRERRPAADHAAHLLMQALAERRRRRNSHLQEVTVP